MDVERALAGRGRADDDDRRTRIFRAVVPGAGQKTGGKSPLTLGNKQKLKELQFKSSGNYQSLVNLILHVANLCLKDVFRVIELFLETLDLGLERVDGIVGCAD